MNNKPVAWMDANDKTIISNEKKWANDIPLYTHPAKPIDKPDECIDGCPKNQTCDYCAGIKTLTDEEIEQIASQYLTAHAQFIGAGECHYEGEIEFARAILRKAQEK
jgi:hypothetical protein